MARNIRFGRPDGKEAEGYLAEPFQDAEAPGVVVLQEWWGLNDQIKRVADRLAEVGYRALVPDLYRGKVTLQAAEAEHLMENLDFADAASQDVRGAVQHLKKNSPRAAVLGFCMGGALVILAAVHVKELDAAVCWYGIPPEEAADPAAITIPLQGHFALEDPFFPPEQVDWLESGFREGNVDYEIYRYPAKHAFGNEEGENYDPEVSELAWQRTLDFLERYLRSS